MKLSCTLLVFAVFAESASCFSGCRRGVRVGGDHQAMGVRKLLPDGKTRGDYVWEDYISVFNRVRDIASGLKSLGFERVRFPSPTCAIFVIISKHRRQFENVSDFRIVYRFVAPGNQGRNLLDQSA
jgi:hypothetical protein